MDIFVINLKEREDRKEYIEDHLTYKNIKYKIIEGINGWELNKNDYDIKRIGTKGALGCYLSHFKCLDLITKPYSIIMEDDISILSNYFYYDIDLLINNLPSDFDICFLGSTEVWNKKWKYKVAKVEVINDYCSRVDGDHYGTGSYIINRNALHKIKKYPIMAPIDTSFNKWGLKQYVATPNLIKQRAVFGSDTQTKL